MASKQAKRQAITLKGSTALVRNSSSMLILFQREVYPSDDFHMVKKYGQTVLVTQDLALENYLERCWLLTGSVTQLVLAIISKDTRIPLAMEIQSEIRAILKQIISMVTYLPVIQEPTVFNILAYTSESADVPAGEWVDTDPLAIEASKSQQVKMRSFSTDVHRIEAMVAYRYEE
ncbi:spindle assembly checkpoint protein [Pholiota molesta]|nr:spindle assembly checkpoint protein [Pholiota molesta]